MPLPERDHRQETAVICTAAEIDNFRFIVILGLQGLVALSACYEQSEDVIPNQAILVWNGSTSSI
jgi:hypothetical protein